MELALYCPVYGFYEKEEDNVGRSGHFYTSVSVGSLFGELLAFQFAEWLAGAEFEAASVQLVEAGAHDGRLAKDVLGWLREHQASLFDKVEYCIVEPSSRRRSWQRRTLREFEKKIRWVDHLTGLKNSPSADGRPPGIEGIIFSNELLDAMPVHRFGWDAQRKVWFEWGVTQAGERFEFGRMPRPTVPPPDLPEELLEVLPDRYVAEISTAAENWWRSAAEILARGNLMTLDYGLTAEELLAPERQSGTLRAYSRHRASGDLLAEPGEQDLTAHVNFSAIQSAGERAGLRTEVFSTQERFLAGIASRVADTGETRKWTPAEARQFQTLVHPEHLGRSFRVLVQSR